MIKREKNMTKKYALCLSDESIKSLKKIAHFKTFSANTPLYYQGQTPIVAYFILRGHVLLLKGNKIYHEITKGCLIGYRELSLNIPSLFTAKALSETEIYYIDKSSLLEIKNSKSSGLRRLYTELTHLVPDT